MSIHHLTAGQAFAGTIAALLLLVQLALFRSVVLAELITLYAVQSFFVAVISLAVGLSTAAWDLTALAILTFLFKVVALPIYLRGLTRGISSRVEIPSRINVMLSLLIAAGLVGVSFLISAQLPLKMGAFLANADLGTMLSIVFIGFLVAILRPNAVTQVIGFLTLENGVFFGAVTLTPGLPFIVGVLVLFDVLVAVVVFAVLVRVLVALRSTAATAQLQDLAG
jgi:hydrogenase-4 component E